jgi:hypothetical protein
MASNFITRRFKGLLPVAAVVIVAVAAVATAMMTLGNTQPDLTPAPSGVGSASAYPTLALPTLLASPSDLPTPAATALLPSTPPVAVIERRIERDPNGIWYADIHYPSLKVGTTPFAEEINQAIIDEVDSRLASFEAGPAALRQLPGKVNTLTAAYHVDLLTPELASYTIRWEDDTSPAHPATIVSTLNFWLKTGQELTIADLFSDQGAALEVVSADSRVQLRKSLGANYDPTIAEPGTAAVATNFSSWALTRAGLKVTFAEFQVGTYPDGSPIVIIPWAHLAPMVALDGPAAGLAVAPASSSSAAP